MSAPYTEFSPAYRRVVLALLVVCYVFNFIDRQLMTILLEPIKTEFGASDTAMGFLTGFAFALFYATLGVPVARLADRWSRRNVLAIAMVLWSGLTALCGAAGSFWQMALLRVGVGVGEAGGTPPSQSLIADYFPPEQRATAMGIHATGPQIGVLLGMFGGAIIAESLGWRMAFVIFGLPGVLVGLLIAVVIREPRAEPQPAGESMWGAIGRIWRTPAFAMLSIATAFTALSGYGLGTWAPSFLIRIHGLSLTEAGLILGLVGTFGALLGAIIGGIACDRLARRDRRWQLRLPAIGAAVSLVFMSLFVMWPESGVWTLGEFRVPHAAAFLFLGSVFSSFWLGPTYAAVQNLAPVHLRTQAAAMLMLLFNLIGMGIGPIAVGVFSDLWQPALGVEALRYAMLAGLSGTVLGTIFYWISAKPYARHIDGRKAIDGNVQNA